MSLDTTLQNARALIDTAPEQTTPEEIAEIALQLAQANNIISKLLSPLKEQLREYAAQMRSEESSIVIDGGPDGRVMVTFPSTQTKLAKDFDAEAAAEVLGSRFSIYFDTKVTHVPRKNLTVTIKTASEQSEQDFVLRCIERVTPTPRVSFKS